MTDQKYTVISTLAGDFFALPFDCEESAEGWAVRYAMQRYAGFAIEAGETNDDALKRLSEQWLGFSDYLCVVSTVGRKHDGPRPHISSQKWPSTEAMIEGPRDAAMPRMTAEEFNEQHPVGTPVRYWPGVRRGEGRESVTRSIAWELSHGTPLVSVEGYAGGIALTHVEAIDDE